jgi:hypothetical protein
LLVVAMLRTIKERFARRWRIEFQGIKEVTEKPIDNERVVSTFNAKLMEAGIEDYLFVCAHAQPGKGYRFIYTHIQPGKDARAAALTYSSHGHEIDSPLVRAWIVSNLGSIGAKYQAVFTQELLRLFDTPQVPAKIQAAWNDIVLNIADA